MSEELTASLKALIGVDAFVALVEGFGGRRLYVPQSMAADHEIVAAIGQEAAGKLSRLYARLYIRVPLARELRARHYRRRGMSNGQIASKLGMTETGVDKMFARMDQPPAKGSGQLSLKF